jgi:signal transduction histidine kinase
MTLLGSRLADASSPPDWLDTLRAALAAPGVALRNGAEVIATSGDLGDSPTARTDLRAGAVHVGELVVALATDDPRLARATEAVLGMVSVPLAQALHAAHLTEDLRVSRGRAVTALEEERRRMRRDLHDGLGPMLTGIAYSADAVANLLHTNPSEALEIVNALGGEARDAIAEIRRIVYGLRPRALDELGLVGAVQQQVSRLRTADGRFLTVAFDAAPGISTLPAAVEVAAYRVAVEALTNVARHSGVAEASASFTLTGRVLRITVADRGSSVLAWTPGVGISSMRERVEQVGGTLWLRAGTDGATVTAEIPLPA